MKDIIVVGGGVIGAFIARYLSQYEASVLVLEKENDVGDVTSMANSAIVHSGDDPVPGTLKAKFNVLGNAMFDQVSKELDVSFARVGSMNLAFDEAQFPLLEELRDRAEKNGVPYQMLGKEEILRLEPNVSPTVVAGILCPTAGIVNPFTLTAHAMENACDNGVELHLNEPVLGIERQGDHFLVETPIEQYCCRMVINAAGLASAKVAAMIEPIDWTITPRKGEYYVLDHFGPGLVKHVLFPLPTKKGKGALVTMTTSMNYLVGPSSEFVQSEEDFATDTLTLNEVRAQAKAMVPGIPFSQQIRVFAGLRSTPSTKDFIIESSKTYKEFINVAGIESPGLASAPAIGKHVAEEMAAKILGLKKKESWNPCIRPYVHLQLMTQAKKNELIHADPSFGDMVCNCEKVSVGEINDALNRSVPCLTIKAVKKRTRAGFGKCQGGFCQPRVLLLLAKRYGISPLEVLYGRGDSQVLEEEVKK